jgi:hypothetical protein
MDNENLPDAVFERGFHWDDPEYHLDDEDKILDENERDCEE